MLATDWLDAAKRRTVQLDFSDCSVSDEDPVLLDLHYSEVMSDSPDVVIGEIVVPELRATFEAVDLSEHLGETVTLRAGLEVSREDVTEELREIAENLGNDLYFARSYLGGWLVAKGNEVYSAQKGYSGTLTTSLEFTCVQDITGMWLEEPRVTVDAGGMPVRGSGTAYFLHREKPYLTKAAFVTALNLANHPYAGFAAGTEEETVTVSGALEMRLLTDADGGVSRSRISLWQYDPETLHDVAYGERIQTLSVRYAGRYEDGSLRRRVIAGEVTVCEPASFGELILTETSAQDEETVEAYCYGILGKLSAISAEGFLQTGYFFVHPGDTFAQLYRNFLTWLGTQGITLAAAEQTYLNLDSLTVTEPDWSQADLTAVTAADVLRCFALLEGGNARMNRDNRLELGWCADTPSMTVSAEITGSLRIGAERLAPATGMTFYQADTRNVIGSAVPEEKLLVRCFASASDLDAAYARIVQSMTNGAHLPVRGELLCGGNPLLRAGDCIRAVTRSGVAVNVQVFSQEIDTFPFMRSRISTPEGTDWSTDPVDFYREQIIRINVMSGWPRMIVSGFPPDTSEMVVRALKRSDRSFIVDPALYTVTVRENAEEECAAVTVHFESFTDENPRTLLRYAMYTAAGEPLMTANGRILAVRRTG